MRAYIPTNHNYYEEDPILESDLKGFFGARSVKSIKEVFSSTFEYTTKNNSLEQIKIFNFKNKRSKLDDEEKLILKVYTKDDSSGNNKYIIQTGLFAGVIHHKGCQFNITTPYGNTFLRRMLNFVNDIYVDTEKVKHSKSDEANEFLNIIAYLFIQSLEKSAGLGLPKNYTQQIQRSHKVRGKVDINLYLKNDFPFRGKLTTSYREQVYVQEIIDVLYLACNKLEKKFGKEIHWKIHSIYLELKKYYSGSYLSHTVMEKAKNHTVLNNPIFSSFKNVLTYAEIILNDQSLLNDQSDNKSQSHGYIFDISQLFEIYLEKLISRHFKDWVVNGQEELYVYNDMFYGRRMFPDLVMRHKYDNKVAVFDAKFKKMRMHKNDLDRSDFYQIHSYIQYYHPKVILGGLLYPLSKDLNIVKAHSKGLFGDSLNPTTFIVDGVCVNENMTMDDIAKNEKLFLNRLEKLLNHDEMQTSTRFANT